MKRKIISWLLVVACCLSLLPGNLVIAEESGETYPSTTTVAYFTDLSEFPESANYAQVITVTGAALTEVGGKTRWDNGLIIVEPTDGYTFDKAWYPSTNNYQDTYNNNSIEFNITTVNAILNKWDNQTIPSKINSAVDNKKDYKAIEIDSTLYNKIIYKTICLDFKDNAGNIISQRLRIFSNEISINRQTVKMGQQFDLFSNNILGKAIQNVKGNNWKRDNFDITRYKQSGSGNGSIPKEILTEYEDIGKYSISQAGNYSFILNDKENGLRYFSNIDVILDENAPLKRENVTVSNNALVNYNKLSQGIIEVQPTDKTEFVMTNIDFSFNLPEEAVIDWSSVKVNNGNFPLELNRSKLFTNSVWTGINGVSKKTEITFLATEENGKQKFSITSDYGLKLNIDFDINYMDTNYKYSISFYPNHFIGFMGGRTYYMQLKQTKNIFDFLSAYGSNEAEIEQNKKNFINNVDSKMDIDNEYDDKRYILNISGVTSLSNPFDGNICFTQPGNTGLYIYDKKLKVLINGWSMHVVMQGNLITTEQFLKLDELINVNNKEIPYRVECSEGITYDSEDNSIKTTTVKQGKFTIWNNDVLAAEFGVEFGADDERLKEKLSNMSKTGGDYLAVNMENNENPKLSKDILNELIKYYNETKDGDGNRFVVTVKNNAGNEVEWDFNSALLNKIAEKDINLSVNVGDGVENKELDSAMEKNNIKGLKLEFYDNGELPGKVKIHLYLSDEEEKMFTEDNIKLYYFDSNTKDIIEEDSGLYIDYDPVRNKHFITITVTHNSDFILSTTDLNKASNSSGTISGGGVSVVYTPAPTTVSTATPVATSTVAPTSVPTATPTATSTPVPTTTPVATSTPIPTAIPSVVPSETATPDVTPTVAPSVKNQIKKVKATKKKVTVKKDKKLDVNFKIVATDNKKAVKDKAKATIKNKKIAKVVKTKVKTGKAVITVKGKRKGKTVLKLNIGGKTAKTTIRVKG